MTYKVFRVFPNEPFPPTVKKTEGIYIHLKDGKRILDTTSGWNSFAILGGGHPFVLQAMQEQLKRFTHIDYKHWTDENVEVLADLLLSKAEHSLDRVYFSGNSGAEAVEAAMKISYQVHQDLGRKEKKWFISREQSYHGATADALSLGERPNLEFYRKMLSPYRARIPMHHPLYRMKSDETLDEYARRSSQELEEKILEIGPDKVCAFLGETMMGGLVGDVPPAPNYWRYIREVCSKYEVHLILDEVYCGTGSSGKIYCCDWDKVTPDFILISKTLAAGYGPLSAVVTSSEIEKVIKSVQGRLQHTTTNQAHSLSVAAAVAVQKIIHDDTLLTHINHIGNYMRQSLVKELGDHEFFRDVRGRGLRFSLEYQCERMNEFGGKLADILLQKHSILISGKWHRVSFTPAFIIEKKEADMVLDCFIEEFILLARQWI